MTKADKVVPVEEKKDPKYKGMNIHQRLHAVMGEVDYVQKQKSKADGLKYSFVSHDAVTGALRTVIHAWGVRYKPVSVKHSENGNKTVVDLVLRFINIDDPSDFDDTESFGYGVDNQDKGPGKAISYAVKYALLKSFGLETGDDPENDNIDHKPDLSMAYDPESNKQAYDQSLKVIAGFDSVAKIEKYYNDNKNKLNKLPKDMFEDIIAACATQKTNLLSKTNGVHQ